MGLSVVMVKLCIHNQYMYYTYVSGTQRCACSIDSEAGVSGRNHHKRSDKISRRQNSCFIGRGRAGVCKSEPRAVCDACVLVCMEVFISVHVHL